jgi:hypothetical protein
MARKGAQREEEGVEEEVFGGLTMMVMTVLVRRADLEKLAKSIGDSLERVVELGSCRPIHTPSNLQLYECVVAEFQVDAEAKQVRMRVNPYFSSLLPRGAEHVEGFKFDVVSLLGSR